MYDPQSQDQRNVAGAGVSTDINTGQVRQSAAIGSEFVGENEIEITITETTGAVKNDVIIIPNAGDTTFLTAVTGITFSTSLGTRAEFGQWMRSQKLTIGEIIVQSTNAETQFTSKLVASSKKLDGNVNSRNINFSKYKNGSGADADDTLKPIKDVLFVVNGWNSLKLATLAAGSTMILRLKVTAIQLDPTQQVVN